MKPQHLSPAEVANKLAQGATLIDVRSHDEHARKHIQGSVCLPIGELDKQSLPADGVVIFHCLSGMRTRQNTHALQNCAEHCREVYVLEGGLNAWQKAGLPLKIKSGTSLDIMRQVQIGAGSLVLLGVVLGASVSPWFYGLAGFVGAGLMFAGLTGFCGMAKLLALMPWNRF